MILNKKTNIEFFLCSFVLNVFCVLSIYVSSQTLLVCPSRKLRMKAKVSLLVFFFKLMEISYVVEKTSKILITSRLLDIEMATWLKIQATGPQNELLFSSVTLYYYYYYYYIIIIICLTKQCWNI